MKRILAVVEDSAAGLRAGRLAMELAVETGAALTVVSVVEDHLLDARLRSAAVPEAAERRARAAEAMLSRVAARAALLGLRVDTELLSGRGAEQVLAAAGKVSADLIVVAGDSRHDQWSPVTVGPLLEFADVPVLVVPPE